MTSSQSTEDTRDTHARLLQAGFTFLLEQQVRENGETQTSPPRLTVAELIDKLLIKGYSAVQTVAPIPEGGLAKMGYVSVYVQGRPIK